MNESIGQALRAARQKRNLSLQDVSRATKMRTERINELEQDDYTRFPNLTYARNFLILYAKYLGVDISKYPTVEVGSTIGLGDYQYLRREDRNAPRRQHNQPIEPTTPEKPRWLIIFFVFVVMAALGALIGWGIMNFQRLGPMDNYRNKDADALTAPTPAPTQTPTPAETPASVPRPSVSPPTPSPNTAPALGAESPAATDGTATTPAPNVNQPVASASPAQPAESMTAVPSATPEVRLAEPAKALSGTPENVVPAEPLTAAVTPVSTFPPRGAVREIKVHASKRIRVRIVRDNPNAPSDYFGSLNPAMTPRTFKGKQFWIKTTDPDSLEVTIDGQPATDPESGVEIVKTPEL